MIVASGDMLHTLKVLNYEAYYNIITRKIILYSPRQFSYHKHMLHRKELEQLLKDFVLKLRLSLRV